MKFKPFKAKQFAPPTQKKESTEESASDLDATYKQKMEQDIETYEVYYTKHINQKIKTWEEGLFTYNVKNFKSSLYNDNLKSECIDTKYMRIKPDFSPDEEFRTNKFLVQIVKRKLEPE